MRAAVPLFGRTPLGLGTSRVESLSGFFVRAAAARNLSTLDAMRHLLIPGLEHSEAVRLLASISFYNRHIRVFDGLGGPTSSVAAVVCHLTGVSNLEQNTLLPWSRFLNPKMSGVLGDAGKRWCAQCFRDWRETGEELREPLAWRIGLLQRCPIHGIELSSRCPDCGKRQPILTNLVPIGYCGGCGSALDFGDPHLDSNSVDHRDFVSRAIGRLLEAHDEIHRTGSSQGFVRLLQEAIARTSTGSEHELSRHLGIHVRSLREWRAGRRRPRFSYFMGVCLRLDVDPATVLLSSSETPLEPTISPERGIHPPWPRKQAKRRVRCGGYSQVFWGKVRCQLEQAIATGGRRSVTHIARAVGVHHNSIRYRFPELVIELTRLRLERTIRARRLLRERLAGRVRDAVKKLVEAGEYPSLERALETAGLKSNLGRRQFVALAWWEARDHYEG